VGQVFDAFEGTMLSVQFDDESKLRLLNDEDRDVSSSLNENTETFIRNTREFTEIVGRIQASLGEKADQVEKEKMHV